MRLGWTKRAFIESSPPRTVDSITEEKTQKINRRALIKLFSDCCFWLCPAPLISLILVSDHRAHNPLTTPFQYIPCSINM